MSAERDFLSTTFIIISNKDNLLLITMFGFDIKTKQKKTSPSMFNLLDSFIAF